MESTVIGSERRRGRKRKIKDVENVSVDRTGKRKIVETRSKKIVARYVLKEFEGSGVFLGKVMSYDSGLYRIEYEDGDCEDLESGELKVLLIEDSKLIGEWLDRKKKLDELLVSKDVKEKDLKIENAPESANVTIDSKVEAPLLSELSNGGIGSIEVEEGQEKVNVYADGDSSSDSCEDAQEQDANMEVEASVMPPPELPPSSGNIGVPEECVSHLFSVYSFLRSFSVPLFLYPFGLDDFVGALNFSVTNTLLDSVHVALMCALKRHLERLSSEGSELASKCLRSMDWNLLDALTWPVYLVHYLMVMGYTDGPDWKGFYTHALERDYYTLTVGRKLIILQILCDDILDSEELRAEIDMREESEVGIVTDTGTTVAPAGGPRRVHPRYSKTSACKDKDAMQEIAERHEMKKSLNSDSLGFEVCGPIDSVDFDQDGNGDECRLCGMDGFLLCCDGCPSSFHSRCLGVSKMYMPEGSWYCPECKINETGPRILRGTALRAGEYFGVDCYEQVFVGACDHLLILKASVNSDICLKYYHRLDIPRVLQALYSKAEHVTIYSDICKDILKYWEMPKDILPRNGTSEIDIQLADEKYSEVTAHLTTLSEKSVPENFEVENTGSCETMSSGVLAVSLPKVSFREPMPNGNIIETGFQSDQLGNSLTERKQSSSLLKPIMTEPTMFTGSAGQADYFEFSQQSTSSITEAVSYANGNCLEPVSCTSVQTKVSRPFLKLIDRVDAESCRSSSEICFYTGSSFKMHGYINYYLHGEFAASAAANLAILSSEESQVPESRSSDNHKKFLSASISLQVKAFSSAATRFFWPIIEKKFLEVPRERCSWCLSCKANVVSKRGCLLNAAASSATKGAMKALTSLRPAKNGEGSLPGISAYVLFMEESLGSLVVGPFLNDTFRKRWRKQIEQATTYNAVKILLLELEENIRTIAISGDWVKLADDVSNESSTSQTAATAAGSIQKRRLGRRGRKPSSALVEVSIDCQDLLADFTWWRGGRVSKRIFQRGILPRSVIKKASRQGGSRKISGICYVEGYETPKRSRQLVWRSAVEMSNNAAELALQVRCLDFHVRWSDLVRPEQIPFDGKGPETEASAFRNAFICGKKNMECEIRYCVAFGSQKHLPSRVMKNITEIEQSNDGKERYWFSEIHIPLYLIKEYEESIVKDKPVDVLSKLQKRQLKGSRKNIFSYLSWKRDNMHNFQCSSCHRNVLFRNAVKCSTCQGLCHQQCVTTSSTTNVNDEVEFLITCKQCYQTRAVTRPETWVQSPTSPLVLQGRNIPNTSSVNKHGNQAIYSGSSAPGGNVQRSEAKSIDSSASVNKGKKLTWGLIWRKKNCEDNGIDFRLKNILLKGSPHKDLTRPLCRLCDQPYNSDLMYIRCETCQHWFHADAVELDESKIFEVVGFKCCKCRRLRSPVCPYLDPEKKAALEKKLMRKKVPKQATSGMDSDSSVIPAQAKEEAVHVPADDPLLVCLSGVEQLTEDKANVNHGWINAAVTGPQKLLVRRHIRQEIDANRYLPTNPLTAPPEVNVLNSMEKLPVRRHIPQENNVNCASATDSFQVQISEANVASSMENSFSQVEWDVSNPGFDNITLDYDCLDYDDAEFEPQTYFSFNELLDSEGAGGTSLAELCEIPIESWENPSDFPQNEAVEISYDNEEPIISVETDFHIPCKICSKTDPFPELACQICGVCLHSHCSPWDEELPQGDGWRCGNCRDWR